MVKLFSLGQAPNPKTIHDLRTPSLVVAKSIAEDNASRMHARCAKHGVILRPHVKTHKTVEGALLQTNNRRGKIVCSTLAEARFFGNEGFDDILYAVPVTSDKIRECEELNKGLSLFHVMVDNVDQFRALEQHNANVKDPKKWSVVLMVDSGYGRDGVDPLSENALSLCKLIVDSPYADFFMIYTHGGNSYDANTPEGVMKYSVLERDAVVGFKKRLEAELGVDIPCSVGSTPSCSHPPADGWDGVAEIHPGNFLMYDYQQCLISSCKESDVACRVLTRVVGHYPQTNSIQVDLGWTGCSAQGAEHNYGKFEGQDDSPSSLIIANLKQEAGTVTRRDKGPIDFSLYPIGSMLKLIPWHACAACHQHSTLYIVDGEEIVEKWSTATGW